MEYENLTAPTINIPSLLKSVGGLGVSDASQIGFTYQENSEGFEEIKETVKDVLIVLQQKVHSNSIYSLGVDGAPDITIKLKIAEIIQRIDEGADLALILQDIADIKQLLLEIGDVNAAKEAAEEAAEEAKLAKNTALQAVNTIDATVELLTNDIADIKQAGATFNTAFDADANFAIVTEALYAAAVESGQLASNCIYFCYKTS